MTILYLDAESRSECDIRKAGGAAYVRHLSTQPIIWTWAYDDEDVQHWDASQPHTLPGSFLQALEDPNIIKVAFNASFDRGIVMECMGINSPVEQWRCALVLAYSLGFRGTLDDVLEQAGFREGKDPKGKQLINLFSTPNPKNWKASWSDHTTHPEKWQEFVSYGVQDTSVLRQLWKWCVQFDSMSEESWRQWFLDQRINARGMPVDLDLCRAAQQLQHNAQEVVREKLHVITRLENPLSNQQMRGWLNRQGVTADSLAKDAVPLLVKRYPKEESWLHGILDLYLAGNSKAAAKYGRFLVMAEANGRVRGAFQFNGAGRTGRWAGRGVQLHNLKRGPATETQPEWVKLGDVGLLEAIYGDALGALAESVRGAVCAPEGRSLVVADLASIESRVVAWLTHCKPMQRVFADGLDTYKAFATAVFEVPYEDVTKGQRTFAKPAVLGGAYMLGGPGLLRYAADMGVELTRKEAFHHIRTFRETYPELPAFWRWISDAVEYTTTTGSPCEGYRLRVEQMGDFLRIKMPSGRSVYYHHPCMKMRKIPYEDEDGVKHTMEKLCFTYMGFDTNTYKWKRISAHGGGLTENVVQALACDMLRYQIELADRQHIDVVGHVHDEIIAEESAAAAEITLGVLGETMSTSPPWAPDLLLGAEGYIAKRYRK